MQVIYVECGTRGLLTINGQFAGPLGPEGQAFPASPDAEIFLMFMPLSDAAKPLAAELVLRNGQIEKLEPRTRAFALLWPDGIIQLEVKPETTEEEPSGETAEAAPSVLLRWLTGCLREDAGVQGFLMRPDAGVDLRGYEAVIPMRFAPLRAPEIFDECAGLIRRLSENTAAVDTALAVTAPAGQGKRLIQRMEIWRTGA